ncbi:MAG: LPS assembly lipoprotein LptE [Candidatus Omnitrophota bacterium]
MKIISLLALLCCAATSGCGYTTNSLLPPELSSIHVKNFANKIDPGKEISDKRASYSYRSGLEIDITKAVIDKFVFDKNLEIKSEDKSALVLKGELIDFRKYTLSYDSDDNVEEYRVEIIVNLEMYNNLTGKIMWTEKSFMGEDTYTLTGPNTKTESTAIQEAVEDLAQRIEERIIEAW